MSKYELSISPSYAHQWTFVDAVREIFQNAIDQETTEQDNAMFWRYDESQQKLLIGNKRSKLSVRSLLLGESTKQNDTRTIGKFGEGYKIATLVLLRSDKPIVFFNYGANEIWKPRFVNSHRYKTQVLTFFVDRQPVWSSVPDHNLTIEISNVTADEFEQIVESNLHMQTVESVLETDYGRILFDEQYAGQVYVNGLWVCKHEAYRYGYDFKPERIKIDRDRKLVSDFDLRWLSSSIWNTVDGHNDQLLDLVRSNAADTAFLDSTQYLAPMAKRAALRDAAYNSFVEEYGETVVPVTSQQDLEAIPSSHTAVIVPENYKKLITASDHYKAPVAPKPQKRALDQLVEWFEGVRFKLSGDEVAVFEATYDQLRKEMKELYDQVF